MSYALKPFTPKPRYIPKNIKHEDAVQHEACRYLRLVWPMVIFRSDFASGLKLTMYQASTHKALQSGKSWPDMFLYHPITIDGKTYCGAAFELKRDKVNIIVKIGKRKGQLTANPHIREQYYMLQQLSKLGYYTDFCIGIDDFIRKAGWYLSGGVEVVDNGELF